MLQGLKLRSVSTKSLKTSIAVLYIYLRAKYEQMLNNSYRTTVKGGRCIPKQSQKTLKLTDEPLN